MADVAASAVALTVIGLKRSAERHADRSPSYQHLIDMLMNAFG
jgi:hypothetical protein